MKNKKLIMAAFLMLLAVWSQNQYASELRYDDDGIGVDSRGNRLHGNEDGSSVIKMANNLRYKDFLRKTDALGNTLDYNDFQDDESHTGWKKLMVADVTGNNSVRYYEVDPQGTVFKSIVDSRSGMSTPLRIGNPIQQRALNELAARLDAIEVPPHL